MWIQKHWVHLKYGMVLDVSFDNENVPVKLNVFKYLVFICSFQLYDEMRKFVIR